MFPLPHGSCEQDQMLPFPLHPKPIPRWKPNIVEPAPNCPRCASSNTKFCYYNNYSLSQPRYFCKACRRYWTKGGFLRKVPVGGGSRKSRRSKTTRPPHTPHSHANSFFTGDHSAAHTSDPSNSNTDIDMALVFAKFLSAGHDQVTNASSSSQSHRFTPESLEAENDAPHPSDPVADSPAALIPPDDRSRSTVQSFGLMSGIEAAEWESLLAGEQEEVVQDVFSSDATTSSSLAWQAPPLMQLQEDLEDPIPSNYAEDVQLPVTDSWSWNSFDLSSLQVFSSPP